MKVKIEINAPGSHGEMERTVTDDQYTFLLWLATQWNMENTGHAAPFFEVDEIVVDDQQN